MILVAFTSFVVFQRSYWSLIILMRFCYPTLRFMLIFIFFLDWTVDESTSIFFDSLLIDLILIIKYFMFDLSSIIFVFLQLLLDILMTICNLFILIQLFPQYSYLFIETIAIWSIFVSTSLYINDTYSSSCMVCWISDCSLLIYPRISFCLPFIDENYEGERG